jgi:hypothetical protein
MDHLMNTVINLVSFIRARGLNNRQFISLLEDVGAEHTDVPCHPRVRWLSEENVLR